MDYIKFNHYDQGSGLSSQNIRAVVEDPNGYMWIGTQDGLNRFDGISFSIYKKGGPAKRVLSGNDHSVLTVDTLDHCVWAASYVDGLDAVSYNTGNVLYSIRPVSAPLLKNRILKSLLVLGNRVLLGTDKGLLELNKADKRIQAVMLDYPGALNIDLIFRDKQGNVWLFLRDGDYLILGEGLKEVLKSGSLNFCKQKNFRVWDVACSAGNELWIASSAGLLKADFELSGKATIDTFPLPAIQILKGRPVFACKLDEDNALWLAMKDQVIKVTNETQYTHIRENDLRDDYKWIGSVYNIFIDKRNGVWLGSQDGLLYGVNMPSPFIGCHQSTRSDISIKHAYFLFPFAAGRVFCCAENGLYDVQLESGSITTLDEGRSYHYLFRNFDGQLIVSNDDGLFVLKDERLLEISRFYAEFEDVDKIVANSHIAIGDSLIILGSENYRGIFIWNYKRHTVRGLSGPGDGLAESVVNGLYNEGNLVYILGNFSVAVLDLSRRSVAVRNIADPNGEQCFSVFMDMAAVGETFWLGSYGSGVIVVDKQFMVKQVYSERNGLSSDGVYKVIPYRDSLVFVTTNNGLSVIDLRKGAVIRRYYEQDGLHSNSFEETSASLAGDVLYAGGTNGFTVIHPRHIRMTDRIPRLLLNNVHIKRPHGSEDTANVFMTRIVVPSDVLQVTLSFSAMEFEHPKRISYMYKIGKLNEHWISMGNQPFIDFIGMPQGKYELEVKAVDDSNTEGVPVKLTLVLLPKWYQTWWFRSLVALVLIGIVYAMYRYRLAQIRKEQQIRQRIASDLHDDIGSTLNSIKVFTNLALLKPEDNSGYLAQLKDGVQNAIVGVRDLVWVLDDKQDTLENLLTRLEQFFHPLALAQHISLECYLDPSLAERTLGKQEKRNLYLIIKEALNNSMKYAEATRLELRIHRLPHDQFGIIIRDNGTGFDASTVRKGNGLYNLQYRANQIKYQFELKSVLGAGTTIVLSRL